jgi:hypothetical protein
MLESKPTPIPIKPMIHIKVTKERIKSQAGDRTSRKPKLVTHKKTPPPLTNRSAPATNTSTTANRWRRAATAWTTK